ncbi:hypothetical protein J2X69_000021 [Algoriphagus sp. 4150]|uniref:hypothetical protein n=1 Tax=Algoriphagus sp. 4150 TaxID=2817756 RepID=UPI00285B441D|nr:hypothetical protein [Algoriphagus sp. 4150]MDR7127693.1 hypothetical protein [Algoriphagus sp. 4150]
MIFWPLKEWGVQVALFEMLEIFEFYFKICKSTWVHEGELVFEFNQYFIYYLFERTEEDDEDLEDEYEDDYYSFVHIDTLKDFEKLRLQKINFKSFSIRGIEFLGDREYCESGRSITSEMFFCIKKIELFQPNIISCTLVDIDYGDPMCYSPGNYYFSIEIVKDKWWDLGLARFLIGILENENLNEVPNLYTSHFRRNKLIRDNKKISIISTNTKVRRLGYFKILSLFVGELNRIPIYSINKKFENFCLKYQSLLNTSKFKRGLVIETKTGISAKPYIDVAINLGMLTKINNLFYIGKSFKVYHVLQESLSKNENIFELSDFDKLYFIERILKNDYFYFSNLLELIFLKEEISYSQLLDFFQVKLLSSLDEYKESIFNEDMKVVREFNDINYRISNWEKAKVYLEHILMPRLNWMLDLEIIKFAEGNKFGLTDIGTKFFTHLAVWNDINTSKVVSPDSFIDKFIVHLYDDCYNGSRVNNPNDYEYITKSVYKHINDSFDLFKTLAPNRVTVSQAANYAKYMLYFCDKIKVGYDFILRILANDENSGFIFKYQEQYQDGYIQKKI